MPVPLCRCRVLYIGSAVPTITADGLQGIQEPLRERYPADETSETKGIDSWLSVWSNGLLLEYVEGEQKNETAFFPINTLHYCAAVRYVNVSGYSVEGGGERFLPLDSPLANIANSRHPPMFAAIFRRTSGIKVLECHAFISTNARAANALVRCCFHAYADSMYLKMDDQVGNKIPGLKAIKPAPTLTNGQRSSSPSENGSESTTRSGREVPRWSDRAISQQTWQRRQQAGDYETASISSTVAGRYKKKEQKANGQKEPNRPNSGSQGALVPYNGRRPQRAGSETDLYGTMRGSMMVPYMGPPGPPGPFMGPMPPPPFFMGPHPPGPPGPGGPHGPPPPGMMGPMPPPMMGPMGPMRPPHPMMMGPGGPMPPPHPGMMGPMMPPFMMGPGGPMPMGMMPGPPPGGPPMDPGPQGPYVTEPPPGAYGTIRGGGPMMHEEPIYMPGTMNGMPPAASYHPDNTPNEAYDEYYDTYYRNRRSHTRSPARESQSKKRSSRSSSAARQLDSAEASYWDTFESGIYRRPMLNEKAFMNSISRRSAERQLQPGEGEPTEPLTNGHHANGDEHRPSTPPADYLANLKLSQRQGDYQLHSAQHMY